MKVDKFIFLVNFIMLDMKGGKQIPLILRRPFFSMGKALIDLQQEKLKMRVEDEEVTFDVFKAVDFSPKVHSSTQVDDLDLGVAGPHIA